METCRSQYTCLPISKYFYIHPLHLCRRMCAFSPISSFPTRMPVPFLRFGTINDLISYLLFSLLSSSLNRGWRGGGRNHTLPTPWATGLLFSSSHCPTRERITTFTAFMVHTTHSLLRRWTQLCLAHSRPWLILPPLCKLASLSWFFRRNFTMVSRGCSLPDPRASSLCPTP